MQTNFIKSHVSIKLENQISVMKIAQKGAIVFAIAFAELSLVPILLGNTFGSVNPITKLFYVFLISSIVSLSISYAYDRKGLMSLLHSKKGLSIIAVAGLCNNAVSQLLLAVGTLGTNSSIAGIMYRSWVLIAALLIPFVLKTKVTKSQIAAILVGFIGVYLVVSQGALLPSASAAEMPYMLVLLGAALAATLAVLIVKFYNASTTASVAVFNVSSFAFVAVLALVLKVPLAISFTPGTVLVLLFLGVVTYGIGSTLYIYAYKVLNPVFVGNATLAIPLATVLIGAGLSFAPIKAYYIYAIVLMASAVIVQRQLSNKAPEHITSKKGSSVKMFDVTSAFITNSKLISQLKADNRALAIKTKRETYPRSTYSDIFEEYGCIAFTNKDPNEQISSDEIAFVNDMMTPGTDETVMVGIGNPEHVENAFGRFLEEKIKDATPDS